MRDPLSIYRSVFKKELSTVFGCNRNGQLSPNTHVIIESPTTIGLRAVASACGAVVTYAITAPDGAVVCSGRTAHHTFHSVLKFHGVRAAEIACGANEVVVVDTDGTAHVCPTIPLPGVPQRITRVTLPLRCTAVAADDH